MSFWICYDNHCTRAGVDITASSAGANFPASNALDTLLYRQWRSQNKTAYLDIDFGVDRDIEFLGFISPRIADPSRRDELQWFHPTTDKVKHFLDDSSTAFGTGDLYETSDWINSYVHPDRGYHAHLTPTKITGVRKWRLQIDCISRTSVNYFDLALVWAGELFKPTINYSFGDQFDSADPSRIVRAPTAGTFFATRYERLLTFQCSFDAIPTTDDYDKWVAFNDHVGLTDPFFFGLKQTGDLGRKSMVGVQARTNPISETNFAYSARKLSVVEYR